MKWKTSTVICVVCILLVIFFVSRQCTTPVNIPDKQSRAFGQKLIIAACDFTSSIDTFETRQNILQGSEDIFKNVGPRTEYFFYPIRQVPERSIIHDSTGIDDSFEDNREKYERYQQQIANEFLKKPSNNTCIIECLAAITEKIKELVKNTHYDKINLVIISDMMEACMVNGEFLNFEKNNFNAAFKQVQNWPANKQFFAEILNLNITVVYNTNIASKYLPLRDFWTAFFEAAGFKGKVNFVTELDSKGL